MPHRTRPRSTLSFWIASFLAATALAFYVVTLLGCRTPFFSKLHLVSLSDNGSGTEERFGYFGACVGTNGTFQCRSTVGLPSNMIATSNSTTVSLSDPLALGSKLQTRVFSSLLLGVAIVFAVAAGVFVFFRGIVKVLPGTVYESAEAHGGTFVGAILVLAWTAVILTWVAAAMVQQATTALAFATRANFSSVNTSFRPGTLALTFHWALAVLATFYASAATQNVLDLRLRPIDQHPTKRAWETDANRRRRSEVYWR